MKPEHLFVLSLSTWRIANLLVNEEGPFEMFDKVRAWFDIRFDAETKEFYLEKPNEIGKMLLCVLCTSIWVAGLMVLLYRLFPKLTYWFSVWLSLSAVACILNRWVED